MVNGQWKGGEDCQKGFRVRGESSYAGVLSNSSQPRGGHWTMQLMGHDAENYILNSASSPSIILEFDLCIMCSGRPEHLWVS